MNSQRVVNTYIDAFTAGGLDTWINTFAAEGTYKDPITIEPLSRNAFKGHFEVFFGGFPDATFETVSLDAISEQWWVWRWILHGTNTGSYRGIPPTDRKVSLPGCEFIEVRAGKVQRVEGYFDRLTMLEQLGLVGRDEDK